MTPLLELKKISYSYPGCSQAVLKNLDLTLFPGEITGILGPSGCGKTTLLKLAASLFEPQTGGVLLKGAPQNLPGQNRILMLQDENQLFPWMTVRKNIEFIRRHCGLPSSREETDRLLTHAALAESGELFPRQLSGGMKRRAALARALAGKPELLLLDEPFSNLDTVTRYRLYPTLLRLKKEENISILLVTHGIEEALLLCTRILILDRQGVLSEEIKIDLNYPRSPDQKEFEDYYRRLFHHLQSAAEDSIR